jgi:hypothetical protein
MVKMVSIGSGAQRETEDVKLSRYACNNSGHAVSDHFEDILGMVDIGSGSF